MKRWVEGLVLGALLGMSVPVDAHAQEKTSAFRQPGGLFDTSEHERPQMLSVYGILPWGYGFGFGAAARYGIPIVKQGFIPKLNDSVELEFGGDLWFASYNYGFLGSSYDYGYTGLLIPVEGQWSFHLTPRVTTYAKVGLGWNFYFWNTDDRVGDLSGSGFWWNTAWGATYRVGESMFLRGEVGVTGLKAGLALTF